MDKNDKHDKYDKFDKADKYDKIDKHDKRDKDKRDHEGVSEDEGSSKWTEMVRKVMSVGLGAAFMTEESVRSALGGLNLPKEVLAHILQGANRSKEEFLNKVGNETIKLISKIDFVKEASRFVEEHKFRIQAEIEIVKKDHAKDSGKDAHESGLSLKTNVSIKD